MSVRVIKNLADLFFWNPWAIKKSLGDHTKW